MTDLSIPGPTFGWSHTRTYNSGLQSNNTAPPSTANGNLWMASGVQTFLRQVGLDIDLIVNAQSRRTFVGNGTAFTAPVDYNATLVKSTFTDTTDLDSDGNTTEVLDRYTLTETSTDTVLVFSGFSAGWPSTLSGKLLERTNRQFVEQARPGVQYGYVPIGGNYRLNQVTTPQGLNVVYTQPFGVITKIEVKNASGVVLQAADYTYYQDVPANTDLGSAGDLVQVKVSKLASDGLSWTVRYTQYRYYLPGGTDAGEASQLKAVYESDAIERITSAGDAAVDTPAKILATPDGYLVAGGNTIDGYASRAFTYYTADLVTSSAVATPWGSQNLQTKYGGANFNEAGYVETESINGACATCGGGGATGGLKRTYFYLDLNRDTFGNPQSTDANEVTRITIEDTQDALGNPAYRKVFGINQYVRLLREAQIENPTLTTQKIWCQSTTLDANRRTLQERQPSAHACNSDADLTKFLDPYDAATNSWANDTDPGVLNASVGVIYVHEYDANGYRIGKKVKQGNTGTANYVYGAKYGGAGVANHIITATYEYPDKQTVRTGGTENTTTFTYTFWDTNHTQVKTKTTTLPIVGTSQNGSGVTAASTQYYDNLGRLRWTLDGEGYINYYSYHPQTGARAYAAIDVDPASLPVNATGNITKWVDPSDGAADTNKPARDGALPTALALETTQEYDEQGRLTKLTTPGTLGNPGGDLHYTVYEANRTLSFPYFNSATGKPERPIRVTAFNDGGQTTETYTVNPAKTVLAAGVPSGLAGTTTQADYLSWTRFTYNSLNGQQEYVDRYHNIPASGLGSPSTHHNRTVTQYDGLGRRQYLIQVVDGTTPASSTEQVTKFSYDVRDRITLTEKGVSGTGHDMGVNYGTYPALARMTETEYDGGAVGDGYATKTKRYYGTGPNDWTGSNQYYTFRGDLRGVEPIYHNGSTEATTGPYTVTDTDWLGRTVATAEFSSTTNFGSAWATVVGDDTYAQNAADANRLSLNTTLYDDAGRAYQTATYAVNASGVVGNKLVANRYYDRNAKLIATTVAGKGGTEYAYDGAGRRYETRTVTALTSTLYDAVSGAFNYRAPLPKPGITGASGSNQTNMSGGNDKVIALDHQELDDAGNVIRSIHWAAYHNDTDGLDAEAATKDYVQTSIYSWYDKANRLSATANYGTNNADYTAAGLPDRQTTAPPSSDTVLVTTYAYDDVNHSQTVTDPKAVATRTTTDDLGRKTRVQEALGLAEERGTLTVYDGLSNTTKLIADLDNNGSESTGDQVTTYAYGDTYLARLLTQTTYPDSQGPNDAVTMTYHLDGTLATRTDQRGVVITFDYDNNRRLSAQRVTTLSTADGSIQSIAYTYDALARRQHVASYASNDATGTPANDIQYAYTDYGALTKEYQAHGGAVNTSTSPLVEYTYAETAVSGAYTKALRPLDTVYPNGRHVKLNYGSGINQDISRVASIKDHDNAGLASYTYLGDHTVVRVNYSEPSLKLDYIHGTAAPYKGLDRFGRVVDHQWFDTAASTDRDRVKYGYDRNSNRTWRQNTLATGQDAFYTYDVLNRLTDIQRGTLAGTAPNYTGVTTPTFAQQWTLDALGNWSTFKQDSDGGTPGSWDLAQNRSHNPANETTAVSGYIGPDWVDPAHDAAGNMTTLPKPNDPTQGYTAVYDAWNRLVEVKDGTSGATVAKYEYDGLGRRIVKQEYDTPGTYSRDRHYYYTVQWQIIEERINASASADRQYVWGLRYVDDLILRDRDAVAGGDLGVTGSGLDERLYSLQDAHFNVTTITDTGGDAVERYRYTPYGERTVLDANFVVKSAGSGVDWEVGHQGLVHDSETGLISNRNRMLHPGLGRFMKRDPNGISAIIKNSDLEYRKRDTSSPTFMASQIMGLAAIESEDLFIDNLFEPINQYQNGMNIYQYTYSNPPNLMDPSGLDCPGCDGVPNVVESACVLQSCAKHDACYANNGCGQSSWLHTGGVAYCRNRLGRFKYLCPKYNSCDLCNLSVLSGIGTCITNNHKQIPGDPLFYCPKQRRFIDIPNDFPCRKDAEKACCT